MDIQKKVLNIAKTIFNDTSLNMDSILEKANGYDSMTYVQFIIEIEGELNVALPEDLLSEKNTILEFVETINKIKSTH